MVKRKDQRSRRRPARANRLAAFATPQTFINLWTRTLVRFIEETQRIIKRTLTDDLLIESGLRQDGLPIKVERAFTLLTLRYTELFERQSVRRRATETAQRVEKLSDSQFKRLVGNIAIRPDRVRQAAFIDKNVSLIRTVANNQLKEVFQVVENATLTGRSVRDLTKDIEKRFSVAKSRANLIARDQVLKLHANLVQDKQQGAGIDSYIWTTSGDERVRDFHGDLEGTTQSWDTPPITSEDGEQNHPGEDFQCRCIAYPIIPALVGEGIQPF